MSTCISGVLVRAKPKSFKATLEAVASIAGAEVRWESSEDGKIVVVLETEGADAACRSIERISAIDGVVDANLSYSYSAT